MKDNLPARFRFPSFMPLLLSWLLCGCGSSLPLTEVDCSRFPDAANHSDSVPPEENVTIDSDVAEKMLLHKVYPKYPELAVRAGLEGKVMLKLWVGRSGVVRSATVVKSDAEIFSEPSLDAARKLVFSPATCNGTPISFWTTLPIRFKLVDYSGS